jgi:hypothetical protein
MSKMEKHYESSLVFFSLFLDLLIAVSYKELCKVICIGFSCSFISDLFLMNYVLGLRMCSRFLGQIG